MSSVTYSLMKSRPLWMAKFLPTNSGTMVQARAQVLIGSRLPLFSARYTFSSNRSSTYGPFFRDRPMDESGPRPVERVVPNDSGSHQDGPAAASPRDDRPEVRSAIPPGGPRGLDLQLAIADALAAADDGRIRRLAPAAGLAPLGQLAGGRAGMPAAGGPALAAAHGV